MRRCWILLTVLLLAACNSGASGGGASGANTTGTTPPPTTGNSQGFLSQVFGGNSAPTFTCPSFNRVTDAARLTRFVPGGHDLTDVAFEAAVGQVTGSCSEASGTIDVQMNAQFVASRGPADKTRKAPFNYFVAIVDQHDNILARVQFDTGVEFPGNQTRNAITEELEQQIPLPKGQRGSDYRIFIGFVLTPDEVAYNRAHP
jgi:hypothetical protein